MVQSWLDITSYITPSGVLINLRAPSSVSDRTHKSLREKGSFSILWSLLSLPSAYFAPPSPHTGCTNMAELSLTLISGGLLAMFSERLFMVRR